VSGIRPKNLSNLNNAGSVAADGHVLAVEGATADWVELDPADLVVPSTIGGRLTPGTFSGGTVTPEDPAYPNINSYSHICYVPYVHDQIALYNGSEWVCRTITPASDGGVNFGFFESAEVVNGTIGQNQNLDIYIYWNGSSLALALFLWSTHAAGTSTRSATYYPVRFQGVWVLSTDNTYRYIGSIRSSSGAGVNVHMTSKLRFLWNSDNQVLDITHRQGTNAATISSVMADHFAWGSTVAADTNYPVEIMVGMPSYARFFTTMTPSAFAQTGITVTDPTWRVAHTTVVNSADDDAAGAKDYTIAHPSVTRVGLGAFSTQQRAHVSLNSLVARTFPAGYHYFRPMWRVEDIPDCSGCVSTDVAVILNVISHTLESLR
jgi:hypothetical protein